MAFFVMKNVVLVIAASILRAYVYASASASASAIGARTPHFNIPEINFNDLVTLDRSAALAVAGYLTDVGIFQIVNIPQFAQARHKALDSLAACMREEEERAAAAAATATSAGRTTDQHGEHERTGMAESTMNDGSRRLTVGSVTRQGHSGRMSSRCGEPSTSLRAAVDLATRQVFEILDVASTSLGGSGRSQHQQQQQQQQQQQAARGMVMAPYRTFSSLVTHGEQLEHLHAYFPPSRSQQATPLASASTAARSLSDDQVGHRHQDGAMEAGTESETMRIHTDGGLLIAMTTGHYQQLQQQQQQQPQQQEQQPQAGLYIQLPMGGTVARAVLRDDALVVMAGELSRWLSPVLGRPIRPVPHAMVSGLLSGSEDSVSRAWYGKMFLPPSNAVLGAHTAVSAATSATAGTAGIGNVTFAALRAHAHRVFTADRLHAEGGLAVDRSVGGAYFQSVSCGPWDAGTFDVVSGSNRQAAEEVGAASIAVRHLSTASISCSPAKDGSKYGIWCWTQCMPVPIDKYPCGINAQCIDTSTGQLVDNSKGHCPSKPMSNCQLKCPVEGGTSSSTLPPVGTHDGGYCTGNGTSMFMSGFQSTAFGASDTSCVDLLFSSWTLDAPWKFGLGCVGVLAMGVFVHFVIYLRHYATNRIKSESLRRLQMFAVVVLYGGQVALSYLIMLVAMTYSSELFAMAIVGLTVGFAMFQLSKAVADDHNAAVSESPQRDIIAVSDFCEKDAQHTRHNNTHAASNLAARAAAAVMITIEMNPVQHKTMQID